MKRLAKSIWRYSWLITLPVSVLYLYWAWSTLERFYVFNVRYESPQTLAHLRESGTIEFTQALRRWKLAWLEALDGDDEESARMRDIHLYVPQSHLAQLNSHLPFSGYEYVDGALWNGDRWQEVRVRYRGDNLHHWGQYKKSYRIQTKKSELFEGMRTFNLNVPMDGPNIQNHLSYLFAERLNLIAPRSELVNVVLNGEHRGIQILIEQLNELTLKRHNYIEGDLYAGELVVKDGYAGVDNLVWNHPGLWQKKTDNPDAPPDNRQPLRRLAELLNSPPSEVVEQQLDRLLDIEAWGRFTAYETLAQCFHFNRTHNWRVYYDPARSLFVPVLWDPMAWAWSRNKPAHLDVLTTRFEARLLQNGNVLRARQRVIEEFFASGADQEFLNQVDGEIAAMEAALAKDPNIPPGGPVPIVEAMHEYRRTIARILGEVRSGFLAHDGGVQYVHPEAGESTIPFSFGGRRPVEKVIFRFTEPLKDAVAPRVRFWRNGRRYEVDVAGATQQVSDRLEIAASLLPNFEVDLNEQAPLQTYPLHLVARAAYYEFDIAGWEATNRLSEVAVVRGAGNVARAREVPELARSHFGEFYAIVETPAQTEPIQWHGDVELSGITEISQPLVLAPGTTIRLNPGAALVVRNRLLAEGTAEEPISFQPAESNQDPWGAVAIVGRAANGSILEHCVFSGGSGHKDDLSDYSGMLSIHDAGRVDISHTRFRDNQIVDDMLHAVYSEVRLRNCVFSRAVADAADLDLCRATIERCRFEDSGDDGVDLLGTHAVVVGSVFHANQDKGVNVSEESRLWAVDNRFADNELAVQCKDASEAILYNIDFAGNHLALGAYLKNWRYNTGGTMYVYKSRFIRNVLTATAGSRSHISIYDSYTDREISEKRISLHDSVDSESLSESASSTPFPGKSQDSVWVESEFWNQAKPARRGSSVGTH